MNWIFRTTLLLALMTGLFLGIGFVVGGQSGMLFAFVMAMVMNVGAYFFSDKIVLSMHNAKEITHNQSPELYKLTHDLVQKAGLPMPRLYRYEDQTPNAFATGRNPQHGVVAVSTGILELLDKRELAGVIAHELAHIKNRDMLVSTIAATLGGAISMVAEFAYGFGAMLMPRNDDSEAPNPIAGLVIALIAPLAAMLIQMAVSRSREFLADETGAKIARDTQGLAHALAKLESFSKRHHPDARPASLATAHLYISNPFRMEGIASLFLTHPPTKDRIARLQKIVL